MMSQSVSLDLFEYICSGKIIFEKAFAKLLKDWLDCYDRPLVKCFYSIFSNFGTFDSPNLNVVYLKMGAQMFVCLSVGNWRVNGYPNSYTDLDKILHAHPHLSKEVLVQF